MIDQKREEMISIAMETGFTSSETITCSQELDVLINKYQTLKLVENKTGIYQSLLHTLSLFVIQPTWTINKMKM